MSKSGKSVIYLPFRVCCVCGNHDEDDRSLYQCITCDRAVCFACKLECTNCCKYDMCKNCFDDGNIGNGYIVDKQFYCGTCVIFTGVHQSNCNGGYCKCIP